MMIPSRPPGKEKVVRSELRHLKGQLKEPKSLWNWLPSFTVYAATENVYHDAHASDV
jgi:hypothetical protein